MLSIKKILNPTRRRYTLAGVNIISGTHNLAVVKFNYQTGVPLWWYILGVGVGITALLVGTTSLIILERKRVADHYREIHFAQQRQLNQERRARKALRVPASRAFQALMRAIDVVRSHESDEEFNVINFCKLRRCEEQIVDDYFARVQELLVRFSPSYPLHVRMQAEIELEIAALAAAWDLHYLRTVNKMAMRT